MIRRSQWHRALAALLGVWFILSGIMTASASCPMHAVPTAHRADAPAAHADGHQHHANHSSAHNAVDDAKHAPDSHAPHHCHCLTDCCGTPAVGLAATTATALHTTPLLVLAVMRPAPATWVVVRQTGRRLPFANGPPRSATS